MTFKRPVVSSSKEQSQAKQTDPQRSVIFIKIYKVSNCHK